jgi:hypothetical protein
MIHSIKSGAMFPNCSLLSIKSLSFFPSATVSLLNAFASHKMAVTGRFLPVKISPRQAALGHLADFPETKLTGRNRPIAVCQECGLSVTILSTLSGLSWKAKSEALYWHARYICYWLCYGCRYCSAVSRRITRQALHWPPTLRGFLCESLRSFYRYKTVAPFRGN